MRAMVLNSFCRIKGGGDDETGNELPLTSEPLSLVEWPKPVPREEDLLIKVSTCGVCHTEIDEIEGRLIPPRLPIVLGHEIVGRIEALGAQVTRFREGDRVGVTWIHSCCGVCRFCRKGHENLCDRYEATGLHAHGGYGDYTVVSESFAYPIPDAFTDAQAAPLLCAGVIGYRALRLTGIEKGQVLGLYGFGASAHIAIQVAKHWGNTVFVFTREGQTAHQRLAQKLGADWVGATGQMPPEKLDCAIDFTPVGSTVKEALRCLQKGGRLVVNAIRKVDDIPPLDYATLLWHEKEMKSVANVTRKDGETFLPLAAQIGISPEVQEYPLNQANEALVLLKRGKIQGAGVLRVSS
jgi:propanol-preferring alcohol dehydrogenase